MKKTVKRTLLVIGILLGLVMLAYGAMFLKLRHEMRDFTPVETGHITVGLGVVRDGISNIYVLRDSLGYVLVDCGNSPKVVTEQLAVLGIEPSEVTTVLLTHTDTDHVGALPLFDHATVCMAREEEQMIDGRTAKFLWFGNHLPREDYVLVDDREEFRLGSLKVEGILVPGHTSGLMAWLVNDIYLFSGDAVSLVDGRIAPVPAFFDMDHEQALGSIEIIRDIPSARRIYTGHWGWGDYEYAIQR